MRGTLRTQKNDHRGLNLHSVGTCKGIMTCGMIIMSKKDALRTLRNVRRASVIIQLKEGSIMVRTRTIKEAAAYFRETDPATSLTETAIRTLLRSGAVPSVRVGKKYLVSLEALEGYLTGEIEHTEQRNTSDSNPSDVWQIK